MMHEPQDYRKSPDYVVSFSKPHAPGLGGPVLDYMLWGNRFDGLVLGIPYLTHRVIITDRDQVSGRLYLYHYVPDKSRPRGYSFDKMTDPNIIND